MKIIILVLIVTVVYLFGMTKLEYYRESNLMTLTIPKPTSTSTISSSSSSIEEIVILSVEISGAIEKEDIYDVEVGTTIEELILLAGGLKEDADKETINFYYSLEEKDLSIYIPYNNGGNKISINTADSKTLDILPGIGEITAEKIVEYRNENGDFQIIEHLMRVKGIGTSTFDNLKDFITL